MTNETSDFWICISYSYLLPPLMPHSPDGGGVAVADVVGAVVGDCVEGWFGSAQHKVKSKPSKPQGLLMA